jgi:hypothetical protein
MKHKQMINVKCAFTTAHAVNCSVNFGRLHFSLNGDQSFTIEVSSILQLISNIWKPFCVLSYT